MSLLDPVSILVNYYKRHGLLATWQRFVLYVRRLVSFPRMVLFHYDLSLRDSATTSVLAEDVRVERISSEQEINPRDFEKIVNFWNPELSRRNVSQRFRKGASIWLIKSAGQLAGFGWTLTGGAIEPHYFPLGSNDVHLFDFLVFPEYRGRRLNPYLVNRILDQMAAEGRTRAYIEAAEWNSSQLTSLSKTGFQLLGIARKTQFFGRTFVQWGRIESPFHPDRQD